MHHNQNTSPIEIERKFLVNDDGWKFLIQKQIEIKQSYLLEDGKTSLRVRQKGANWYLSVKSKTSDTQNFDFEYEIPESDASILFSKLSKASIEKTRYEVKVQNNIWEIDVFKGNNAGLIIAEIELLNESVDVLLPDWIGEEVTHDYRYLNSNLAKKPINTWDNNVE